MDRRLFLGACARRDGVGHDPAPSKSGIRIGTVKDGKVTAFIPESVEVFALEAVAADAAGNVYGGYTNTLNFRRWVKK